MREEKKFISEEYLKRLNGSPFFLVVDYRAVTVLQFTELRKRLRGVGAEVHVVKNSIFRIAAKNANLADLAGGLTGQLAVVTGVKDVSSAAKVVKTFQGEFDKPKLQYGYLGNTRLEAKDVLVLADLPSIEVLRAKLLGVLQAPAAKLVQIINAPGAQLASVIQAHVDQVNKAAA